MNPALYPTSTSANVRRRRMGNLLYLNVKDRTWWIWTATTALLILGLSGHAIGFTAAMLLTVAQGTYLIAKHRSLLAFPVQLRLSYLLVLVICALPGMHWLYWWPTIGTLALIIFGYCLLARILSLLPWNRKGAYSIRQLRQTFLAAPDLTQGAGNGVSKAGGICTIEAQIPSPQFSKQA